MKTSFIYHPIFLEHNPGSNHPESSKRLKAVLESIEKTKIPISITKPNLVNTDHLELVHTKQYVDFALSIKEQCFSFDPDTRTSQKSIEAALYATGAVVDAVDLVMKDNNATVFCAVRPPGHHALSHQAMGFCIFNNVAVGAAYAIKNYGLERVLIFDPDVHHGNGTEEIFYKRNDVYYISIHQYPYYPGTGRKEDIGEGDGKGYNANFPLSSHESDKTYIHLAQTSISDIIRSYQPQLILFSAGFDAHELDPLASMKVTTEGFWQMYKTLMLVAREYKIPFIYSLEGGYSLPGLSSSVTLLLKNLLDF